jgi:3-oxoacyl-[acyl-carrier-protein] synthase II
MDDMKRLKEIPSVVVTGLGLITPCGNDRDTFWNAIVQGKSGIGPITLFDASDYGCRVAGEVKNFNPEDYMDKKDARRMDRFIQFAMVAAQQAYYDAKLTPDQFDPERFSVVIGTGSGGITSIENQVKEILANGPRKCSPFFIPMMISDMAAGRVSIALNAQGPNLAVVTACATGTDAIGTAYRMIQNGEADMAIAGGAEAVITPSSVAGFVASRAMSRKFNDQPTLASRPFDTQRDGFVIGEGASVLILETREHAEKRGARIYAEIVGYGRSSDAYDIVSPHPEGRGAIKAMQNALKDAELTPESIGYINAHATSTPVGDRIEAKAINTVFQNLQRPASEPLLVSATKGMTGHMLGAAGSTEAIITILALQNQIIPPTINVEQQDPDCELDIVPNTARKVSNLKRALSNSFGFAGHNSALIFEACD